ncbi:MAG: SufD family Fe-S cluster assembly protein [Tissierellia bacterium]|nr:SufD family Fe-S cluster assembly protein [Tissierellia bacterium]
MELKVNELKYKTYEHLKINDSTIVLPKQEKGHLEIPEFLSNYNYGMSEEFIKYQMERANEYHQYDEENMVKEYKISESLYDVQDIIVEEGQKKKIRLIYHMEDNKTRSSLIRLYAKKNAEVYVDLVSIGEDQGNNIENFFALVEEDAKVYVRQVLLGGHQITVHHKAHLKGERSKFKENSIYFGVEDEQIDLFYDIVHEGAKSWSSLHVHGALKDYAYKKFRSTLDFLQGSSQSEGSETEYVTLLSDTATNIQVPVLLCNEDDVLGDHAASCGNIDPDKMFYLQSRGLSQENAERLIVKAKFAPTIERIEDEQLRNEIWKTIDEKIR